MSVLDKTLDKINVLWFIPTHGESRYLGTSEGGRHVDLAYLTQVAKAKGDGINLPHSER